MCLLTSRQDLHLYMTVYSIHSTARHANLSLSLAHPGRSQGLPDKQSYIEIFNSSQRLDQGVNVLCLGVQDGEDDGGEEEEEEEKVEDCGKKKECRDKEEEEGMEEEENRRDDDDDEDDGRPIKSAFKSLTFPTMQNPGQFPDIQSPLLARWIPSLPF